MSVVGETTIAPMIDRSISDAGFPSIITSTPSTILNRGRVGEPAWASAARSRGGSAPRAAHHPPPAEVAPDPPPPARPRAVGGGGGGGGAGLIHASGGAV